MVLRATSVVTPFSIFSRITSTLVTSLGHVISEPFPSNHFFVALKSTFSVSGVTVLSNRGLSCLYLIPRLGKISESNGLVTIWKVPAGATIKLPIPEYPTNNYEISWK